MAETHSPGIDTSFEINELAGLSTEALRERWLHVFKRPLPPNPRSDFLLGSLAYELQAQRHGFLKSRSLRALNLLASDLAKGLQRQVESHAMRPGIRLLRTWQGDSHEVLALEKGFSYRGKTYGSLSEIARLITGVRWSGPLFFGLKGSRSKTQKASLKPGA
jgi:hypothetical protein